jgi:hypothetical protein
MKTKESYFIFVGFRWLTPAYIDLAAGFRFWGRGATRLNAASHILCHGSGLAPA